MKNIGNIYEIYKSNLTVNNSKENVLFNKPLAVFTCFQKRSFQANIF